MNQSLSQHGTRRRRLHIFIDVPSESEAHTFGFVLRDGPDSESSESPGSGRGSLTVTPQPSIQPAQIPEAKSAQKNLQRARLLRLLEKRVRKANLGPNIETECMSKSPSYVSMLQRAESRRATRVCSPFLPYYGVQQTGARNYYRTRLKDGLTSDRGPSPALAPARPDFDSRLGKPGYHHNSSHRNSTKTLGNRAESVMAGCRKYSEAMATRKVRLAFRRKRKIRLEPLVTQKESLVKIVAPRFLTVVKGRRRNLANSNLQTAELLSHNYIRRLQHKP